MRSFRTSRSRPGRTLPVLAVGSALALVTGAFAATGPAASAAGRSAVGLTGTTVLTAVVPHLDELTDLGPVSPAKAMTVGITIPGNTAARQAAYAAITTPGSASYDAFLTPAQIAQQFGVSPAVSAGVQQALEADGLRPVYVAKDGGYLELSGTAVQVEKTFSVSVHDFEIGGRTYFANLNGATVPAAVSAVSGLTDLTNFQTHADQGTCAPSQCTGVVGPSALWSAYDMPNTGLSKKGNLGQGQKVAIFGEGDLTQVVTDLRDFEGDTDVNGDPTITKPVLPHIPVRETLVNDDQTDTSGLGEWDLDSQASTGMSPDLAELDFYFGQDLSDAAIDGIYSAWVNDPDGPAIGNSSFGGCEPLEAEFGDEVTDDAFFQEAVMEGRTMFASTGDTGSGGCVVGVDLNGLGNGAAPAVEYPAASPYVVAVGGTVLYTAATTAGTQVQPATRSLEYAWTYTGGGSSAFEPQPADQAALGGSPAVQPCIGTPAAQPLTTPTTCRAVPDVAAMSGDVLTNGYGIVSDGAETETGGTSLSSPLWAGMWARVRAAHAKTCSAYGSKSLGFAQPLLYDVAEASAAKDAKAFFDVGGTTDSQPSGNGTYTALPRTPGVDPTGYDLVSGLGVPDLTGLTKSLDCGRIKALSSKVPNSTVVTIVPPSTAACPPNGTYSDPAGDETPADVALDLTSTDETSTSTGITFTSTLSGLPESNPAYDDLYDWDFSYSGGSYEVEADAGLLGASPTYTLYQETVDATTGETDSTSVATLTGGFDPSTGVVSAVLPFSTFNTAVSPSTPLGGGAVLTGLFVDTQLTGYDEVNYSDELAFGSCSYDVGGNVTT